MPDRVIDLNADLGEGFGVWKSDDGALLDVVTSANIACGFHAGDPPTMRRACERAVARGVRIGAHVGYRDLVGFGRRRIDVEADDLVDDVLYQIGALDAFARAAGDRVRYVKPHGALYNTIVSDGSQAAAVVEAVRRFDPVLTVLGPRGSRWLDLAAAAGLARSTEGFADRAYRSDGRLVSRRLPGAVVDDPDEVVARSVRMAVEGTVVGVDGTTVTVAPRSICVHGDTPGAAVLASRVREGLHAAGVDVLPFT
ncbi:LamB/YcsF family protein [Actinoallomurus sp. CA-150999]|uniref:LamB/YcsF family protein n=1 Tax=Actinoallomurus sp. CA-150999 TaxID=3239887 RepID=UPI003D90ACD1